MYPTELELHDFRGGETISLIFVPQLPPHPHIFEITGTETIRLPLINTMADPSTALQVDEGEITDADSSLGDVSFCL
jgi:hypothetical protein